MNDKTIIENITQVDAAQLHYLRAIAQDISDTRKSLTLFRWANKIIIPALLVSGVSIGIHTWNKNGDILKAELSANGALNTALVYWTEYTDYLFEKTDVYTDAVINRLVAKDYEPVFDFGKFVPVGDDNGSSTSAPARSGASRTAESVAAQEESGGNWCAYGYDRGGGASYGRYQIATRTGTMLKFFTFLKRTNRHAYRKLLRAGGIRSASQGRRKFVNAWCSLSRGKAFRDSQFEFIYKTHYLVQVRKIRNATGYDVLSAPLAIQAMTFSTAIQQGPNTTVIVRAIQSGGDDSANIIRGTFANRAKTIQNSKRLKERTKRAVYKRYAREMKKYLAML